MSARKLVEARFSRDKLARDVLAVDLVVEQVEAERRLRLRLIQAHRQSPILAVIESTPAGEAPHHAIRWEPASQSSDTWSCLVGGHARIYGFTGSFVPAAGPRENGVLLAPPERPLSCYAMALTSLPQRKSAPSSHMLDLA
jgi:hypothetical protein